MVIWLIGGICVAKGLTAADLRCEYLDNPLGIEEAKPRLSWIVQSDGRHESQSAWEILVASSPERLARNDGDLWDSGKFQSDESTQIEYGGAPLHSRTTCWWKVRVWDGKDKPADWSKTSMWEMGFVNPEDWRAKWISAPLIDYGHSTPRNLVITSASFEATDGSGSRDVTDILSALIHEGALTLTVSNSALGGDPAPNHVKILRVNYTMDGQPHSETDEEKSLLNIGESVDALPYLRKDFNLRSPIKKARLYVTALGIYEVHINGQRVGDALLAPDWTDYGKRVRYQVYDVTSFLQYGDNTLGAFVGNGWYSGHIGNGGFEAWGKIPALFAQLELTAADGTITRVVTDGSWRLHAGPIIRSDFMLGENYDARKEMANWDRPGIDLTSWQPAEERTEADRSFSPQVDQLVRQTGQLPAKSVTQPQPGRYIFDLGQNMVGVVRLKVSAPSGTKITLRHGEMLNPDGTLYTRNLRGAPSIDTYICKGEGNEVWQPRFTFHGFRYVELSGLPQPPSDDAVTGIVIGTDYPHTGTFSCSNPDVNQLQSNIQWGMRGNYLAVPTDCPQRDERMGWMGDAQTFVRTATYNGDVAAFFTKWLVDVDDSQLPDGRFTDVSPAPTGPNAGVGGRGGVPAWGDAGVICPWTIYLMYGDKRILTKDLPAMIRWVDWCQIHSTGLIRDRDRGPDYGDWLSQGENTEKDLIGTAFFAHSADLVAKACRVTGDIANADKYQHLFEDIKAAFDAKYVTPDGHIQNATQTAYSLALSFDLLPDDLREKVGQYLADDATAHDDHLTTGFVGVGHLLPSLSSEGQTATAYRLLLQDTFPSWLFAVKQGATTIWERWDGWTRKNGFQDPSMNSFNHYSLGSCGEWMFDRVAGIGVDPDHPGFKHIIIHPEPGGDLTEAEGSYNSIHGLISTKWTLLNGFFTLHVTIPANTTATVELPTQNLASVRLDGSPIGNNSLTAAQTTGIAANYLVGSGAYDFPVKLRKGSRRMLPWRSNNSSK